MAAEFVQRIGQRMKEAREAKGLTQLELALALPGKVGSDQISRWERGIHKPEDDTLEQIAEVLEVSVAYFLAAEPDKSKTPDPFPSQAADDALAGELAAIRAEIHSLREERSREAEAVQALLKIQNKVLADLTAAVETEKKAKAETEEAKRDLLRAAQAATRAYEDAARRLAEERGKQAT